MAFLFDRLAMWLNANGLFCSAIRRATNRVHWNPSLYRLYVAGSYFLSVLQNRVRNLRQKVRRKSQRAVTSVLMFLALYPDLYRAAVLERQRQAQIWRRPDLTRRRVLARLRLGLRQENARARRRRERWPLSEAYQYGHEHEHEHEPPSQPESLYPSQPANPFSDVPHGRYRPVNVPPKPPDI